MKCSKCRNEAKPHRTRCEECSKENNEKSSDRRQRLILEGRCVRCGQSTNNNGKKQCDSCCEKQKGKRDKNKSEGLCSQCEGEPYHVRKLEWLAGAMVRKPVLASIV